MLGGMTIQRRRRLPACHFSQPLRRNNFYPVSQFAWPAVLEEPVRWQPSPLGAVRCCEAVSTKAMRQSSPDWKGQLIGPWVQDVEQCCRKTFATPGSRTVQADLSTVHFVDAPGGARLARMNEAGFRLAGENPAPGRSLNQIRDEGTWGRN